MDETKEILTIAEIADTLRVSTRTVRNWIDSGKLKAFKFGLQYRVHIADFQNFIKESEVKNQENEKEN